MLGEKLFGLFVIWGESSFAHSARAIAITIFGELLLGFFLMLSLAWFPVATIILVPFFVWLSMRIAAAGYRREYVNLKKQQYKDYLVMCKFMGVNPEPEDKY